MGIVRLYWVDLLEFPLQFLPMGRIPGWGVLIYKICATLVALWILWGIVKRAKDTVTKALKKESLLDPSDYEPYTTKNPEFQDALDASDHLEATIEPMLAKKQYDRVAEIYVSLNRPEEAARYFLKAGDKRRAAEQLAKTGKTLKAAKLLQKAGDHATAGRFFAGKGKHTAAGKAYEKAGDWATAAREYGEAGKVRDAARAYAAYFEQTADTTDAKIKNAEACYRVLETDRARKKLPEHSRTTLLTVLAEVFGAAKHYGLAATLFQEAGDPARAADVYMRAGKFQEAAQCMRAAGRNQDAQRVMGRFYEGLERWPEAGAAYAQGGEFRRAGDCFARANDRLHAAQSYEKAGEFYRASVGYIQSKQHKVALRALKQISEGDPNYDHSRLLVGRCYYELKDYEMCAAALENQLSSRVAQKNVEYFKMLADVYDKLNKGDEALSILRKVKTVSVKADDIDEQISSIQTRMSRLATSGAETHITGARPAGPTAEMTLVAKALGQRFTLERELGRGGMGVVYLARDTQLDRPVALKFLGSMVDGSDEFRERFLREAKTAAKVNHPNIVAIYDIGADRGKVYIAMEYVDGPSLHRLVRAKGRLMPKTAVSIIGQATVALAAVHEAGIIHRDIKPDNILIARGGLVKLTDFGLAKGEGPRLTQADQVLGTPCYMSPEQARGGKLDARSDIYSMGLVLHEALTGVTYFSEGDVMQRQQEEMPPLPSTYAEDIPKAVDEVVMKCVAKDPNQRFQTAQQLLAVLRQLQPTPSRSTG